MADKHCKDSDSHSAHDTTRDESVDLRNIFVDAAYSDAEKDDILALMSRITILEEDVSQEQVEVSFNRMKSRIYHNERKRRLWRVGMSVAASVIFVIISFYFGNQQTDAERDYTIMSNLINDKSESDSVEINYGNNTIKFGTNTVIAHKKNYGLMVDSKTQITQSHLNSDYISIKVPYGRRGEITLEDGTHIWLNSGTKLVYPSKFDSKQREIYVVGEIYLDVTKDTKRPFIVKTKKLNVQVLGTKFNVSAYEDEPNVDVVLVEGGVEVATTNSQTYRLVPREMLSLKDGVANITHVDVSYYTSWKDGYIKLNSDSLSDVFKKLSRHFNVKIYYDSNSANDMYSGKLDITNSIDDALYNISMTAAITYSKADDQTVYIMFN